MSYYLPYFIRIINDLIIDIILNQYEPIAKTINSTILTPFGKMEKNTNAVCGKN